MEKAELLGVTGNGARKAESGAPEHAERRAFLKTSLLAGGGVMMLPGAAAAAQTPAGKTVSRGYKMTAHVRRYYDSARRI